MYNERLEQIINTIAKGDTSFVETFFKRPGGRKYLENITLILINTLPQEQEEKEALYVGFVQVLNKIETRIRRQAEGQKVLDEIFKSA
jgi:hypothetical protein